MIRAGLISVFFILWVHVSFTQDRLVRMDGTEENVNIIEVNPASVRYTRWEEPTGAQIVISKSAIYKIIYENGTEIIFGRLDSPQREAEVSQHNYYRQNHLTFGVYDLIDGKLALAYENIFLRRKLGLQVRGSWKFTDEYNSMYYEGAGRVAEGTLAANWYPFGHEKITSYFGLSLVRGTYETWDWRYDPINDQGYEVNIDKNYKAFSLDYGARYTSRKGFVAGARIGIGSIHIGRSMFYLPFNIDIGYAF
jgi:hypothetical protein